MLDRSMTKSALEGLTQGAAAELGPKGVRVNSLAPGVVATNIFTAAGMPASAAEGFVAKFAASNPLRRIGNLDDMAKAASFFADGTRSGYVTGATLVADGGFYVSS